MKKRRPHTIPLTEQALELLETLKPHSNATCDELESCRQRFNSDGTGTIPGLSSVSIRDGFWITT
jgi:integrase